MLLDLRSNLRKLSDMSDALVAIKQTPYPRPPAGRDFAFLYEGFQARKLLVRRCSGCGRYMHPPGPMCAQCGDRDWRVCESTGRGTVHTYTVHYHPPIPPFICPHAMVLADMEEGFRFFAAFGATEPCALRIGIPVYIDFIEPEPGYLLPVFRHDTRRDT